MNDYIATAKTVWDSFYLESAELFLNKARFLENPVKEENEFIHNLSICSVFIMCNLALEAAVKDIVITNNLIACPLKRCPHGNTQLSSYICSINTKYGKDYQLNDCVLHCIYLRNLYVHYHAISFIGNTPIYDGFESGNVDLWNLIEDQLSNYGINEINYKEKMNSRFFSKGAKEYHHVVEKVGNETFQPYSHLKNSLSFFEQIIDKENLKTNPYYKGNRIFPAGLLSADIAKWVYNQINSFIKEISQYNKQ